jgi:hypothetical protein
MSNTEFSWLVIDIDVLIVVAVILVLRSTRK